MALVYFQLISLVPLFAAWGVVLWYRKRLPFPGLWRGLSLAMVFAVAKRLTVIAAVFSRDPRWLAAYGILTLAVPVTMFFVGLRLLRQYAARCVEMDRLEARAKTLIARLDRQE